MTVDGFKSVYIVKIIGKAEEIQTMKVKFLLAMLTTVLTSSAAVLFNQPPAHANTWACENLGIGCPQSIPGTSSDPPSGPVRLCNGDVQEETLYVAVMYYNLERRGWFTQGWYNIASGRCAYIFNYVGDMFAVARSASDTRIYADSNSSGFCAPVRDGFSSFQNTTCRSNEQYYQGLRISVPSSGINFTFGNPGLVRE